MSTGNQRYVIWINQKKAVLGYFDEKDQFSYKTVYSGIDTRVRFPGESTNKVRLITSKRTRETSEQRKLTAQIAQFCKEIISQIHTPEAIYILGPADTKTVLQKTISGYHEWSSVPVKVKSADNLTISEIKSAAARFFKINLRKPSVRRKAF